MNIIPKHKIDKLTLPGEYRHRKRSGKKRWKVVGTNKGPKPLHHKIFWNKHRTIGKYVRRRDAERAVKKLEKDRVWKDYDLEIVRIKRSS